jgi:hypothetical protein
MGITSLRDCDKAMYSASVVLNAICLCSLDAHVIGQPTTEMMYPVLYFAVLTSFMDVALFQFPQKSASAYTSKDFPSSGSRIMPCSQVNIKYLHMCSTASAWDSLGD